MRAFAGDPPIEERVGEALDDADETVAVAESVTGGLVSALLTSVPGSSAYVDRGFTIYAYDAWRTEVGVARETLDEHGAVSEEAARELAARARDLADATWGLGVTGIAGPSGGSDEKPVGTAFVGVAHAAPWESGESAVEVENHGFDGDRIEVRERIARAAMSDLLAGVESTDTV